MTHPYLPLYVDDFEAATAHLTIEEDGVYNRLLRLCWRTPGCSIPNDPAWIARKIRLSAVDFERVARPVIDEFFKVQRGRLVQKRLKEEYDDISRKKSARKKAGSSGGRQKALNAKENVSSNASDLPAHTRAFPEPEPEPEEPPVVPPRGTKGAKVTKAQVQAVWSECPVIARQRSSMADVESALNAALRRGHQPEAVLAGLLAAYRSETYSGDKAKGVHRLIEKDRWASFIETSAAPAAAAPSPTFDGPPALRASIVAEKDEDFAVRWLDHYCRWREADRTLLARTPAVAATLNRELAAWLARVKVTVSVDAANDPKPDLFARGDAA